MKHFILLTLCSALFCFACQKHPVNTQKPNPISIQPHRGPVSVRWEPQLLGDKSAPSYVPLSDQMFQIQAASSEEIVFETSEHVLMGAQTLDLEVNVESQYRHDLQLSFSSSNADLDLEILINNQIIYTGRQTFSKPLNLSRLALKNTNNLSVKIDSNHELDIKIQVIQRELTGHVFSGGVSAALSLNKVFTPYGEESGDLRAEAAMPVSGFRLEDDMGLVIPFESDVLLLELLPGMQEISEDLEQQYGLETRRCLDIGNQRFCSVYFDFEKAPLVELPRLLQLYQSEHPTTGFSSISFSSLRAMQTLALALKLHYDHYDAIAGAELNGADLNAPVFASSEFPVSTTVADDWKVNRGVFGDSWWLLDTRVREAWLYSLGTGARAAYIDVGWENKHNEVEPRRFLIQPNSNQTSKWYEQFSESSGSITLGDDIKSPVMLDQKTGLPKTHGIVTVQTGFGERDNGLGNVGVAPNATVIPYSADNIETAATSVIFALEKNIHVIGLNKSFPANGHFLTHYSALKAAIEFAYQQEVPVVAPTGNTNAYPSLGKGQVSVVGRSGNPYVINVFPCGMNKVICVGGAEPYHNSFGRTKAVSPAPLSTRGLNKGVPIPGKENLWIAGHSLFNTLNPLVWAPSNVVTAAATKNTSGTYNLINGQGTSYACPFVTGVVALMKSRNPQLTADQVRHLLLSNRSIPMLPSDDLMGLPDVRWESLNYRDGMKLIDVPGALTRAMDSSLSGQSTIPSSFKETYASKNYPGIIDRDGSGWALKLNESLNPSAPADKQRKTLIQSVSDVQWAKLSQGKKVNVQGWTGESGKIRLGNDFLAPQEIEVLQFDWTLVNPVIHQVEIIQNSVSTPAFSATQPFEVKVSGEHLMADIAANKSLELVFHEVGSSNQHAYSMDYAQPQEYLNNEGTTAVFVLNDTSDQTHSFLQTGKHYQVSVRSFNGSSNKTGPTPSSDFRISSTAPEGATFSIKSINPPVEEIPTGHYVYDQVGSQWIKENARLPVETNDFAGLYFTQPIRQLTVKVGPVELPVVSVLRDLAVLGIPEDLPAGVHELTLEVDGQTVTLKDALEKITPAVQPTPEPSTPASASPEVYEHLRVFNVEGNDEARVYINGQLALTAHAGDEAYLNLGTETNHVLRTDRPNEIIFEYENRGGGYTLGYSLESASHLRFYHEQGKAGVQNVVNRDGSEDQRQGVVFRERLLTHRTAAHPVGSGALWVKVFNMDQGDSIVLSTYNETEDIQWNTDRSANPGKNGEWVKQLPWPVPLYCEYYDLIAPSNSCWADYSLELRGLTNSAGSASYGMEVYRGVHRVFHQVYGQVDGWGMNDNATTPGNISLGYENAARFTSHGHHPVFYN